MRNLLIFITKYNAFFLFLIFEISSIIIYVKYNSFQKATFINSTGKITGDMYAQVNDLHRYLQLKDINDSLAHENGRLKNQLRSSFYIDTLAKRKVTDTVFKQQYEYVVAQVINNSINRSTNYITIDRGTNAGLAKGMGVICSTGVVGKIIFVGEHYSVVQSLLHKETIVSAMLAVTKDLGSFAWGDNLDPHTGLLYNVSNNAAPKIGELVVTSDLSLFPAGIAIGKVASLHAKTARGSFLNMDVNLSVDFSKLQYVYVVNNKFAKEQLGLEAQEK